MPTSYTQNLDPWISRCEVNRAQFPLSPSRFLRDWRCLNYADNVNPTRLLLSRRIKQTPRVISGTATQFWVRPSPLVPLCLEKVVHHILVLPSRLTWVGICALKMFCSVSMETPGAVVAKCGLWLSVAGLGIPGWLAPVFTSDPFPKAWMAFSGTQGAAGTINGKTSHQLSHRRHLQYLKTTS